MVPDCTLAYGSGQGGNNVTQSTRRQGRLSATDWADIALVAIGEGGLAAVAIEPLAARLGATKGSFYWHFSNREALIDAALARWEAVHTEEFIVQLETEPDPAQRLRRLLHAVISLSARGRVEMSLLATADHPQIAPVLRRVTERRIAYVAKLFEALGFPHLEARRRAVIAFSVYLGHVQLAHATPNALPSGGRPEKDYLELIFALLTGGDPHG
jgi:AcrR family transcriptional regulator